MAYDRYDWHCEGDFPADLPEENAGTHIGMFLAWVILRGLEGEFHQRESAEALEQLRKREITGRDFLFNMCDGKFWDEDLSEEGNAFAKFYYDGKGTYFEDFESVLSADLPSTYHVEDTWENFGRLCDVIDERYEEWKKMPPESAAKKKPWWQFWKRVDRGGSGAPRTMLMIRRKPHYVRCVVDKLSTTPEKQGACAQRFVIVRGAPDPP